MIRTLGQAVKLKRQALGWSPTKLAAESGRAVEEIRELESGGSIDERLTAALLARIDSAIVKVLPLWEQIVSNPDLGSGSDQGKAARKLRLVEFGKLLRDRRNKAQLSRLELAKLAGLSDATIKFIEVARHPPSRRTCQALVGVSALGLKWEDVAVLGYVGSEPAESTPVPAMTTIDDSPAAVVSTIPKPHDPTGNLALEEHAPERSTAECTPSSLMCEKIDQGVPAPVEQSSDSSEQMVEEVITHIRRTFRRQ